MEEIEYLDFVDENNNVIEKEDLCMNDFDYLLEKAKEEKIEKNVVGSVSYTHLTLPTIYSV